MVSASIDTRLLHALMDILPSSIRSRTESGMAWIRASVLIYAVFSRLLKMDVAFFAILSASMKRNKSAVARTSSAGVSSLENAFSITAAMAATDFSPAGMTRQVIRDNPAYLAASIRRNPDTTLYLSDPHNTRGATMIPYWEMEADRCSISWCSPVMRNPVSERSISETGISVTVISVMDQMVFPVSRVKISL